jgi:hypothetical protein
MCARAIWLQNGYDGLYKIGIFCRSVALMDYAGSRRADVPDCRGYIFSCRLIARVAEFMYATKP